MAPVGTPKDGTGTPKDGTRSALSEDVWHWHPLVDVCDVCVGSVEYTIYLG